jgi:acyl-CoA synthetase (AMP-forming)/AMP-acid ligase II
MVWTSPYEPVDTSGTLLDLIAATSDRDRPALVDGPAGASVSYGTLAARTDRVAAGLAARGITQGDVVAVWAPNGPQWAAVALGAMAAGAAVTGISPSAAEREVQAQLLDSRAAILVAPPSQTPDVPIEVAAPEALIAVDAPPPAVDAPPPAVDAPPPAVALDPDAVALLPYSSGTTGLPKGVMLTHRNLVVAVRQIAGALRLTPRDTLIAVAPFAHVMGFVVNAAAGLAAGATVVTMPRFALEPYLDLVERHGATVLVVPPPIMNALARHPAVGQRDLSSVELVVCGGAPLGADVQRGVAERLPGVVTRQGWGLTETGAVATSPDRARPVAPGSVGRPMPSTAVRVVDPDTGADLGPGERGELWLRGPQVMAGYLGRPDATAAMVDADGWLRTGDLGVVDDDGQVFVVDRLKELIKVSAHHVPPAELEALIATHPAIADVAVVPRPDPEHGEIPIAVVVARGALDADELIAWVAERVAPYKRIRAVRFAGALPRTPAGKLLRRLLVAADGAVAVGGPAADDDRLVIEVRGGAARGAGDAGAHAAR